MDALHAIVDLEHLRTSHLLLGLLLAAGVAGGILFKIGLIGWALQTSAAIVRAGVGWGFLTWKTLLGWASWPQFLTIVVAMLVLGQITGMEFPAARIPLGLGLITVGASACFAYMYIDRERIEVERGYKSLHNVQKGQRPAEDLKRHGRQVTVPLLLSAAFAAVAGFAMLNQGLYETVGRRWYTVSPDVETPNFADFTAFAATLVMRLVDVLDVARSHHLLGEQTIIATAPPARLMATGFKVFFTVVLLHQVLASVRQGKLLAEMITDFWSPHEPIHERARGALPVFGVMAVDPLLKSLRGVSALTKEQRERLPLVMETMGPAIIPSLTRHLDDPYEHVREISAAVLGRLHAIEALDRLKSRIEEPSELVRQAVVEALGRLGEHVSTNARRPTAASRPTVRRKQGLLRRFVSSRAVAAPKEPIEEIVTALAAALDDESQVVRDQVVASLAMVGPAASGTADRLIAMSTDEDEGFRREVALALGVVGGEIGPTLGALTRLLSDSAPAVRSAAASALAALGAEASDALPALVEALQDRDEEVRETVAEAVSRIGPLDEVAADALAEGLVDPDTEIRARTAQTLGSIGPAAEETVPALVDAIDDESDRVRAEAVEAIGKIGEEAAEVAVPGLIGALSDEDVAVAALAAESLGRMGAAAAQAVPALMKTLDHLNAGARANAAQALGAIGSGAGTARPALEAATSDADGDVRAQALVALGRLGPASAHTRDLILKASEDEDAKVRVAAVEAAALAGLGDAETIEVLRHRLDDSNDQVKIEAARVLPRIARADPELIEGLCRQLLDDDAPEVQAGAALALGKIGVDARSAGEALLRAAQTGSIEVRRQAMRAMAMIRPPEAAAAFTVGLRDASEEVRVLASAGLLNAEAVPDGALDVVVEALRDPEVRVRANAAGVLARLDSTPGSAVPALIDGVADPNDALRINAAKALRSAPAAALDEVMSHLTADSSVRVRLEAARTLLDRETNHATAGAVLIEALADPSPRAREEAFEIFEALGDAGGAVIDAVRGGEPEIADDEAEFPKSAECDRSSGIDRSPEVERGSPADQI